MSSSTTQAEPQCVRSEHFFYDDGSLFLLAVDEECQNKKVYRLHPSLLRRRSGMLNDMLTLPPMPGPNTVMDGMTEEAPIELPWPKFTIRKFDNLLVYLFVGPSDYPKENDFLFDLLDLAHYLDMPDAIKYVIEAFEKKGYLGNFHPALKFRLGRAYGIIQWVEPATRAMMAWPGSRFTEHDAADVGFDVYFLMVSTRFKVEEFRKGMAYNAPTVATGYDTSVDHSVCKQTWEDVWWTALGPHILRPDWDTVGDFIRHKLKSTPIPGMCQGCQSNTLDLMEEMGLLTRDVDLVEECIAKIKDICGDTSPIRRPLVRFTSPADT